MCEEMHFWQILYLLQVWFFCIVATMTTFYYRYDMTKQWLNAVAYLVAGYSTVPGIVHLSYYTED